MSAVVASSSNLHSLDIAPQSVSSAPTPTSPSFQIQHPNPARSFINLNPTIRGQSTPFPTTPTSSHMHAALEPPQGTPFGEFVRTWTDNHIATWLGAINCARLASTFKENDIRGDILLELDQDTLKEMGVSSVGDRLRILNAVRSLRHKTSIRVSNSTPPKVFVNGDVSNHSPNSGYTSPSPPANSSRSSRRLEAGRPAPLQLNPNARENGLPRIVATTPSATTPSTGSSSRSTSSLLSARNQPLPLPPNRSTTRNLGVNGRRTPDIPSYVSQPLPPAPPMLQVTTYGLPSDPRAGNPNGKPAIGRTLSPLQPPGTRPRPTAVIGHVRNISHPSVESPVSTVHNKLPPRPPTCNNNHPYATTQSSLAPNVQQNLVLSPIVECFTPPGSGRSPPIAFTVGSGPFKGPVTPSHSNAPSLDDLRRKLVKFLLPEDGHSCTVNVADCAGGIEVMEKVLKKLGKGGNRSSDGDSTMEHVRTEEGGLIVDGWGVFIDWGQGGGTGESLTEAELMSICHAPPDNPVRENGLTLRKVGKAKRHKGLAQMFGDGSPTQRVSPTSPRFAGHKFPTGEDGSLLSPGLDSSFNDAQVARSTKRASSISILSGLGVRDPEKALDPPSSPSQISPVPKNPVAIKKPSKLRNFFGQRPPSELITTHLTEYFPFTEKKVLERTARHSMMRTSGIPGFGKRDSKRDSAMSWNPPPASRFSSSTQGSQGRTPTSRRTSVVSVAPSVPEKTSASASPHWLAEDLPRISISADDGRNVDLNEDDTAPQLLPPVQFASESFSESMEDVTGNSNKRASKAMSTASRRMSYMTELRSKRDRSDTASLMTVDEITAEVESRRTTLDGTDEWTKVDSDEDVDDFAESSETTLADGEEYDDDDVYEDDEYDEEEELVDDGDAPCKKSVTQGGTKWIKGALIGAGSFGKVYLGMDAANGLLMAVKQVELPTGSAPNEERKISMLTALELEIELLKDLQHENIVQYLYSSLEEDYLNIFLEYVPGGSVTALLRNYGAFEETLVKNFVRQILQGLNYLHERNIIHRDIKGANILVDNKGGIKISDFGISKKVEGNLMGGNRAHRPSLQGSVFWMAPEVVKQVAHTKKADIWSVGCLVVEMLTGEHPWAQLSQMQAIFKIGSSAKPAIPSDISADAQEFLQRTFDLDHDARPSAAELLEHPWIAKSPAVSHKGGAPKINQTVEVTA